MNRFDWAQIPVAIIGAVFLVFVANRIGYMFYETEHLTMPVYEIEGVSPWADVDLANWQREWPAALASTPSWWALAPLKESAT